MKNHQQENYNMNKILTLKKDEKTEEKKQKKVKNLFKTLNITEAGVRTIGIAQNNFENFWCQLDRIDASKYEKQECLDRLKEACNWITRGIAKYHEVKED